MEEGQTSHNNKKRKHNGNGPKQGPTKKFQGKCYVCNKQGHRAKDCHSRKDQGNPKKKRLQVNVTEVDGLLGDVSDMNLSAIVSVVNFIGSNTKEWWVDTRATCHVCSDKTMFSSYHNIDNGEQLFMGNSSSSKVEGQGKVVLKMTSGKELTLNDVLHVPEIRKNLVSESLLSKKGFNLVFVSNNFILIKIGMYVGKGYMSNGLFKINVMTIVLPIKNINKNTSSAYMLEFSNVWHGRLGHVNYNTLRRLINMECLPKFKIYPNHKCEICVNLNLQELLFNQLKEVVNL